MSKNEPSIKKNYLYTITFQIFQIIVPLVTAPYVSRVLGVDNIGVQSIVNANFFYFNIISVLGLGTYAQLESAKIRDDKDKLSQFFVEVMSTKLLTVTLTLVLYIVFIYINGRYTSLYVIQAITLAANAIDVTWLYAGLEQFKTIMTKNIIVRLLTVVCVFVFVRTSKDLFIYILINVLGTLFGNILIIAQIGQRISFTNIHRIRVRRHLKGTMIFFLPTVASLLMMTVDRLMIDWLTHEEAQNGYYEQAAKIDSMLFVFFSSLNQIMRSRMANLSAHKKKAEMSNRMYSSLRFVSLLAFPFAFGLESIADIFVPWYFGNTYMPVAELLKIMAGWLIFKPISNCLIEQHIIPNGGQITAAKIIWAGAIINIGLNYMFIPEYKAIGAAIASLSTEGVILILTLYTSRKAVSLLGWIRESWKYMIAAIIMFIVLYMIRPFFSGGFITVVIDILVGIFFYVGCLFLLKDSFLLSLLKNIKNAIKMSYYKKYK